MTKIKDAVKDYIDWLDQLVFVLGEFLFQEMKMNINDLKHIQKYLIDNFDFDSMITDLIALPDIGVITKKDDLKEYAAYAINYVFTDKRNITISLTGSYLKVVKNLSKDDIVYSIESKLSKNSVVSINIKKDYINE